MKPLQGILSLCIAILLWAQVGAAAGVEKVGQQEAQGWIRGVIPLPRPPCRNL